MKNWIIHAMPMGSSSEPKILARFARTKRFWPMFVISVAMKYVTKTVPLLVSIEYGHTKSETR